MSCILGLAHYFLPREYIFKCELKAVLFLVQQEGPFKQGDLWFDAKFSCCNV